MVDGRRILSAIAVTGLAAVSLWGVIRVVASADLDEQPVQGSSQDSGQRAPDVSEAQGVEVRQERRSSIEADSGRAVDPDAKTMAQCLASHGIQVVQEILAADAPAVLYERLEEKVEAIRDRLGVLWIRPSSKRDAYNCRSPSSGNERCCWPLRKVSMSW